MEFNHSSTMDNTTMTSEIYSTEWSIIHKIVNNLIMIVLFIAIIIVSSFTVYILYFKFKKQNSHDKIAIFTTSTLTVSIKSQNPLRRDGDVSINNSHSTNSTETDSLMNVEERNESNAEDNSSNTSEDNSSDNSLCSKHVFIGSSKSSCEDTDHPPNLLSSDVSQGTASGKARICAYMKKKRGKVNPNLQPASPLNENTDDKSQFINRSFKIIPEETINDNVKDNIMSLDETLCKLTMEGNDVSHTYTVSTDAQAGSQSSDKSSDDIPLWNLTCGHAQSNGDEELQRLQSGCSDHYHISTGAVAGSVGSENRQERVVPTNKQIYKMLREIDWVIGYHSSGDSIEVYVSLQDLDPRDIERQLADRTGAPREKFHVMPNEESSFGFYDRQERVVPTNKQLYKTLREIYWVEGYYSDGDSIEVYVNFRDLDPRDFERELADRTCAPREKFHVKPIDELA